MRTLSELECHDSILTWDGSEVDWEQDEDYANAQQPSYTKPHEPRKPYEAHTLGESYSTA